MKSFFYTLRERNSKLYLFGWACIVAALFSVSMVLITNTVVMGINAWIKPFKFFLSSAIFSWTMGWLLNYLKEPRKEYIFTWVIIAVLGFETLYIAFQAARGELSHFNDSSPFYSFMFGLMGFVITVMTLWTGYIGWLFFSRKLPDLPRNYLWAIRFGIIMFVIFALQGGVMGQFMSHTIGAPDGGPGLPVINWSTRFGDLRIAHFFGMHALQILPFTSFYLFKTTTQTVVFAIIYFLGVTFLLVQALMGLPLLRM